MNALIGHYTLLTTLPRYPLVIYTNQFSPSLLTR
jgi:hypothetical protein